VLEKGLKYFIQTESSEVEIKVFTSRLWKYFWKTSFEHSRQSAFPFQFWQQTCLYFLFMHELVRQEVRFYLQKKILYIL